MKIAHISRTGEKIIVQDLKEHLYHTAVLCKGYMKKLGCPSMGYIVGILHDAGKAGAAFQRRMAAIMDDRPDPGQKGGHSSIGAVILNETGGNPDTMSKSFALQAMCEAIFSHHAALPDNISPEGEDGYKTRLQCAEEELREIEAYLWEMVISKEELKQLVQRAYEEADVLFNKIREFTRAPQELGFFLGMVEKMLLSALIDADWLDSAISEHQTSQAFTDMMKAEGDFIESVHDRKQLFEYFLNNLENRLKHMNQSARLINVWRNHISDCCKEAGNREGGIYTLSCPTGAGKTLAVTRFALSHCIRQNKDRIFYIIPYLTVIDQTAKSIKTALSREEFDVSHNIDELVEGNVLELHSQAENNKSEGTMDKHSEGREELSSHREFWTQRMAEPIVLTTMVRFLNTFFASGTRNLRPAHRFTNAVIIFDEIQTLPIKQIALFNSLINYLAYICGCTCVLCTATQPLLGETEKPVYPVRMGGHASLAELPGEALDIFKRVHVEDKRKKGGYSKEELADFIWNRAVCTGNVLAIMNTKNSALAVYNEIVNKSDGTYKVYYLSTRLYAEHRKRIIDEIGEDLSQNENIIVVSTQLIEAGIDFDFSCVVRSLAGMDSIVQAAGRCNREGKRGVEFAYIVNLCNDLEPLEHLRDIKEGARASERLLDEFKKDPETFEGQLLSEKALHTYFQYYFWKRKEEMVYPVSGISAQSLFELLADNGTLVRSSRVHKGYEAKALNQSFRTASENFNVIEDGGYPVFVPRGRGKEILDTVRGNCKHQNMEYTQLKVLLKDAQQFVVNLRSYEIEKLGEGGISWEDQMGMYVLNETYYDENTGFTGEISGKMPFFGF